MQHSVRVLAIGVPVLNVHTRSPRAIDDRFQQRRFLVLGSLRVGSQGLVG